MSFSASEDSGFAVDEVYCGGTNVVAEKLSLDGLGSVSFEAVAPSMLFGPPPIEAALRGLLMIL